MTLKEFLAQDFQPLGRKVEVITGPVYTGYSASGKPGYRPVYKKYKAVVVPGTLLAIRVTTLKELRKRVFNKNTTNVDVDNLGESLIVWSDMPKFRYRIQLYSEAGGYRS